MKIIFLKSFIKSFDKLSKKDRDTVTETLSKFKSNPFDADLKNHALKWGLQNIRAISAKHDLRILYKEEWDHAIVYLIKTGTHNQVY